MGSTTIIYGANNSYPFWSGTTSTTIDIPIFLINALTGGAYYFCGTDGNYMRGIVTSQSGVAIRANNTTVNVKYDIYRLY